MMTVRPVAVWSLGGRAPQPCDPTQLWPCLQSTLTEFATSQGYGQSGSAALPASEGNTKNFGFNQSDRKVVNYAGVG